MLLTCRPQTVDDDAAAAAAGGSGGVFVSRECLSHDADSRVW